MSDWDFLCPPHPPPPATGGEEVELEGREERGEAGERQQGEGEEGTIRRPSLDDFDGEIAVFQVGSFAVHSCSFFKINMYHILHVNTVEPQVKDILGPASFVLICP